MDYGIVVSDGLNLHQTPNGRVIDQIAYGNCFDIMEERLAAHTRWFKTLWNGKIGWVAEYDRRGTRLVKVERAHEEQKPSPPPKPKHGWRALEEPIKPRPPTSLVPMLGLHWTVPVAAVLIIVALILLFRH